MTAKGSRDVCAGVDIGGTAVRVAILGRDASGDGPGAPATARASVSTPAGEAEAPSIEALAVVGALSVPTDSFAALAIPARVERLAASISGLLADRDRLVAVGIGASGPVDVGRGVIDNAYTLPAFSGFPLVAALESELGCPVFIESDAVVAAVAEHRVGAGRRAGRLAMVTLGTGIGVSLLVDGKPFRGSGGAHPEGGHIPIVSGTDRCYCGIAGCWEQVASRSALQALLGPLLPSGTPPERLLHRAAAAASTDPAIRDVFAAYGGLVGRGLCALQALYMPDVVVLGGSAAAHLDLFRAGMDRELDRPADFMPAMAVRGAVLQEAGTVGAALLADQRVRELRAGDPLPAGATHPDGDAGGDPSGLPPGGEGPAAGEIGSRMP